jgi:hypothetical protein
MWISGIKHLRKEIKALSEIWRKSSNFLFGRTIIGVSEKLNDQWCGGGRPPRLRLVKRKNFCERYTHIKDRQ